MTSAVAAVSGIANSSTPPKNASPTCTSASVEVSDVSSTSNAACACGKYVNIIEIAVAMPLPKAIVASRPVPPSAAKSTERRLPSIQTKRTTPRPKTKAPAMIAVSFFSTQATNAAVSLPSGRSSFSSRNVPTIQSTTAPTPVSGA